MAEAPAWLLFFLYSGMILWAFIAAIIACSLIGMAWDVLRLWWHNRGMKRDRLVKLSVEERQRLEVLEYVVANLDPGTQLRYPDGRTATLTSGRLSKSQ